MSETLLDNSEQPQIDNYLNEFVGEDKKYKTQEDLAKAYYNADTHIKVLEKRLDALRDDYLKEREERQNTAKLEDLIKQLDQRPNQNSLQDTHTPVVRDEPSLKPDDIRGLLADELPKYMSAYERSNKEKTNLNTVKAKLTERLGPKYQDALRNQMEQIGLSEEDMNALAKKSPDAFFRLFEQRQPEGDIAPPRSSATFTPKVQSKHKKWSEWQQLRKDNPKMFYDPKISRQMDVDSQALGEAFFDID